MITALFLMTLACSPALAASQDQVNALETTIPDESRQRLASLVPKADRQEATQDAEMALYSPARLYEYIDGASEGFIAYGFVALAHATYKKQDTDVVVDIYDMGTAENAFGVYSSERSPDSDFVKLGAEGYESESMLNFLQGRYYVKLSGFSEKKKVKSVLDGFGRDISQSIGVDLRLPEGISLLPRSGLKKHTESFIKQAPLGYGFLTPAYSARYSFDGKDLTVLLSLAGNETEAMERIEQLREQVAKSGEAISVEAPSAGFKGSSRYQGDVFAFPRGACAVVILGQKQPPEQLIKEIVATLDRRR